jgi:hypothetical protein
MAPPSSQTGGQPPWPDRAAEEFRTLGSLTDVTFRGIVRDLDRLPGTELRALVTTLLAFGPEPVATSGAGADPHHFKAARRG